MPFCNAFEKKALVITIAMSLAGMSIAARADALKDLKEQIETLKNNARARTEPSTLPNRSKRMLLKMSSPPALRKDRSNYRGRTHP